jgi:hypothetical protein
VHLLVYILNVFVSSSLYTTWNDYMIVKSEMGRICEEADLVYLKLLSRHVHVGK